MIATILILIATFGLFAAAIAITHAKVKIGSVLVHHATHFKLVAGEVWNRPVAQALATIALVTPFDAYRAIHDKHHDAAIVAGPEDEEAEFLRSLGFRPGLRRQALWRLLINTLFSPRFHYSMIKERLRHHFLHEARSHRAAALLFWVGVISGLAANSLLPEFLLGAFLPLMIGGNVGSLLELASRHRWMVSVTDESRRDFELSHGRFLLPIPPLHVGIRSWFGWIGSVALAGVARLTVVPGDLNWHIAHHLSLDLDATAAVAPAWVDPALAFSDHLRADPELEAQSYTSIRSAIDAWFIALEREGLTAPAR